MATVKDPTRPHYTRAVGECGIYLAVVEAIPKDHSSSGSIHFYAMETRERLQSEWENIPLHRLKGEFERSDLLRDVILERVDKGLIISVSCESLFGADGLWTAHESGQIQPIIERIFITADVLQAIGAKNVKLCALLWRDEFEACREEVEAEEHPLTSAQTDSDKAMVQLAHRGQKELTKVLLSLRDDFAAFNRQLGELTVMFKMHLPHDVSKISTYDELKGHVVRIEDDHPRAINKKPWDAYNHIRDTLRHLVMEIETYIWHPLAQVHAKSETYEQQKLKRKLIDACAKLTRLLADDYDFSQTKHSLACKRVLLLDHKRFLGFVSVVFIGLDTIVDVEQLADDYMTMSGA